MKEDITTYFDKLSALSARDLILFILAAVWIFAWKGIALWISAKEDKKSWFIPFLIFNTAGILEIIYIFAFSHAGRKYIQGFKKHKFSKKEHIKHSKKNPEE